MSAWEGSAAQEASQNAKGRPLRTGIDDGPRLDGSDTPTPPSKAKRRVTLEIEGKTYEATLREITPEKSKYGPLDMDKPFRLRKDWERSTVKIFEVTENFIYGAIRWKYHGDPQDGMIPMRWQRSGLALARREQIGNNDLVNYESQDTGAGNGR